jgi:hypothetical protein
MDTADAVIARTLEALRQELGERIRTEQTYQEELAQHAYQREAAKRAQREEFERLLREGKYPAVDMSLSGTGPLAAVSGGYFKRLLDIDRLEAQVKVLQELQETLDEQRTEKREGVDVSTDGDEHSSKQSVRLTVIATSAVSLIVGWLLSLVVGTPTTILHVLGH